MNPLDYTGFYLQSTLKNIYFNLLLNNIKLF